MLKTSKGDRNLAAEMMIENFERESNYCSSLALASLGGIPGTKNYNT